MNTTYSLNNQTANTMYAPTNTYKRVLVPLDGTGEAERAIAAAIDLARPNDAEIVLVCANEPGAQGYINAKCDSLQHQNVRVRGYTINGKVSDLPNWLINSEKADAIVLVQKPVGWLMRLFGGDVAASLKARTRADVYVTF